MLALNIIILNRKIAKKNLKSYDSIKFNYQNNSSEY